MFPLKIRMNVVTLLFVFVVPFVYGQDRKINTHINPGCSTCNPQNTLIYIQATGSKDTIHQVWDFTRGVPTIIFAIGSFNSTLTLKWDGVVPQQFVFSETPRYSFAAALDKLIEYNDLRDNGHIDPALPKKEYSLRRLTWKRNSTHFSEREAMLAMRGHFNDRWGSVEVKLDLIPFKDYAIELPHLIHTANSTLVDVSLVNLTMSREFNASRFALRVVLASTDPEEDSARYAMRKSLDDEHTPGVFEIVEIKTPESYSGGDGGFIQFRPVAYTQRERNVGTSTITHNTNFNRTSVPHRSTLEAYFAKQDPSRLLVQDMVISFGEAGDGFYKQHNYTGWSFTIGYGAPPIEGFSLFVIVIISVGLAVPVALALSGIAFVLVRRYRHRNMPARFTDDD